MIMEIGKTYIVPVITVKSTLDSSDHTLYQYVILDNLHGDKENGQPKRHYHVDTRFKQDGYELRIDENRVISKIYEERVCIAKFSGFGTSIDLLVNTKLKRRCLSKDNRCPHKGYDLTGIEPNKDGELVCPLHNLRFNANTKIMIEAHQNFFDRKIMMDKLFPEFSLEDRNLGVKLGYEFPYIDPRMKGYEEKKLELLALRREREENLKS